MGSLQSVVRDARYSTITIGYMYWVAHPTIYGIPLR